jgi:hypothetical protein
MLHGGSISRLGNAATEKTYGTPDIISYFKHGANVHDRRIVTITAHEADHENSACRPKNAADVTATNSYFYLKNVVDQ